MGVTLKDVAREAQVSTATVSRVINGHGNVSDATRERILGVAERLRYVPDSAARSLSTGLTDTIGVLLPDLYGEFFSEIIRGIDQAPRGRRLHLLLSGVHGSAEEAALAIRALRGRVDGLLIMSPYADAAFLAEHSAAETPVVLMNTPVRGYGHSAFRRGNRRWRARAGQPSGRGRTPSHRLHLRTGEQLRRHRATRGVSRGAARARPRGGRAGAARRLLRGVGLSRRTEPAGTAGSRMG